MAADNRTGYFLFVGNGSYQNRGCEAIVRGTMEILRREFEEEIAIRAGVYADADTIRRQNACEIDPALQSYAMFGTGPRLTLKWWAAQANRHLKARFMPHLWSLHSLASGSKVALELGGDNYSLDYGRPESFMAMDRYLMKRQLPVVLWGASVGPFDADPQFAARMFEHLRKLLAIFVRETESLDHLHANGVTENVHLVADPAFAMTAIRPDETQRVPSISAGTIGLNFSPLVARNVLGLSGMPWELTVEDLRPWVRLCADIVKAVCREFQRPVLLIPHVSAAEANNDDFSFLRSVHDLAVEEKAHGVTLIEGNLSAPEMKWVISECSAFAGARTHATIASISSGVPTLSLGYSRKARGLNRDIYGHLDYCLSASCLTVDSFMEHFRLMMDKEFQIREHLRSCQPQILENAFRAGTLLRNLLARQGRITA